MSGQDSQFLTGGQMRVHAVQAIGVLAGAIKPGEENTGLQMIAAKDAIDIQAQSDTINVQARDMIDIISANAHIDGAAAESISLSTAGAANITVSGGNITVQCPGKIIIHAGKKSFVRPRAFLRFADTQMMAGIATILTPAQHAAFFEGIGAWWIVDHRGALSDMVQLHSTQPHADPVALPLQFNAAQNSALLDATRIPALAAQLRYADPAFGTLLSFVAQSECISRGIAAVQDAGQADDTELLSYCLEYWQQQHSAMLSAQP